MVLLRYFLIGILTVACQSSQKPLPLDADAMSAASSEYLVLAQKALTYQADFRLNDWSSLLAEDVEYDLPAGDSLRRLRGKVAVLAHWRAWKDSHRVREVRLSGFTILPVLSPRAQPLADLPGVYVPVACRRRVTYLSGQVREEPLSQWMHFDEDKLIDRLYDFAGSGEIGPDNSVH